MIKTQSEIIEAIVTEALGKPDLPVLSSFSGAHMFAVMNESATGLCSKISGLEQQASSGFSSDSVHDMVKYLECQNTNNASWGLAAINSLLNCGTAGQEIKVQELIHSVGQDKNVAIVGHFPFVEKMGRDFKNFWVLELIPQDMDISENLKNDILPKADLVAITATTLLNGTLGEILSLTRKDAVRIMLGPSTPLASCLLDMGFDYLGGARVNDSRKVSAGIRKGLPFRKMDGVGFVLVSKK